MKTIIGILAVLLVLSCTEQNRRHPQKNELHSLTNKQKFNSNGIYKKICGIWINAKFDSALNKEKSVLKALEITHSGDTLFHPVIMEAFIENDSVFTRVFSIDLHDGARDEDLSLDSTGDKYFFVYPAQYEYRSGEKRDYFKFLNDSSLLWHYDKNGTIMLKISNSKKENSDIFQFYVNRIISGTYKDRNGHEYIFGPKGSLIWNGEKKTYETGYDFWGFTNDYIWINKTKKDHVSDDTRYGIKVVKNKLLLYQLVKNKDDWEENSRRPFLVLRRVNK